MYWGMSEYGAQSKTVKLQSFFGRVQHARVYLRPSGLKLPIAQGFPCKGLLYQLIL